MICAFVRFHAVSAHLLIADVSFAHMLINVVRINVEFEEIYFKNLITSEISLLFKMFVLALLKQTVRVPADKFKGCFKENQGLDLDVAIKQQLNKKLANKVRNIQFVMISVDYFNNNIRMLILIFFFN